MNEPASRTESAVVIALRADASAASGVETATRLQDTGAPRNRRLDVRARVLRHLPSHSRHLMNPGSAAHNRTAQLLPRGLTVAKTLVSSVRPTKDTGTPHRETPMSYEALSSDCRCGSGYRYRTDLPDYPGTTAVSLFRTSSSHHSSHSSRRRVFMCSGRAGRLSTRRTPRHHTDAATRQYEMLLDCTMLPVPLVSAAPLGTG